MTWIKLHNDALLHKRVRKLTHQAKITWIYSLCYCNQNLTDGILDQLDLDTICDLMRVDQDEVVPELIRMELFFKSDESQYEIRDYLDYQTSKSQIEGRRSADRKRKRDQIKSGSVSDPVRFRGGIIPEQPRIHLSETESEVDKETESDPQPKLKCDVDIYGQPIEHTKRHFIHKTLEEADQIPERKHWRDWLRQESIRRRVRHFDPWAYAILTSWISGTHEPPPPLVDVESWQRAGDLVNNILRQKREEDAKIKSEKGYLGINGEWIALK